MSSTKKYELTGEPNDHGLRRIRQLSDGALGGWIESEENLSQEGSCWVYGDARVYGNARVSGNGDIWLLDLLEHSITYTRSDDSLAIGCHRATVDQWIARIDDLDEWLDNEGESRPDHLINLLTAIFRDRIEASKSKQLAEAAQ